MIILYESAKAVGNASPGRKPGTCFKHIAVILIHLSKLLVELGCALASQLIFPFKIDFCAVRQPPEGDCHAG
jgi:hypothetical protein